MIALRKLSSAAALAGRLFRDRRGGAALEFALLSPILAFLLAAAADFGGVVHMKLRVENAVSAAANYAIVNSSRVAPDAAEAFARDLVSIIALNAAGVSVDEVVVNNAASAALVHGSVISSSMAGSADACYCPSLSAGGLAWGASVACGGSCPDSTRPGRFITVRVSQPYTPLISGYGVIQNNTVSVRTRVQVQ